jgi:hypothetical protein
MSTRILKNAPVRFLECHKCGERIATERPAETLTNIRDDEYDNCIAEIDRLDAEAEAQWEKDCARAERRHICKKGEE